MLSGGPRAPSRFAAQFHLQHAIVVGRYTIHPLMPSTCRFSCSLLTPVSATTPAGAAAAEVATATRARARTSTTSAVSKTGLPLAEPVGLMETPAGGTGDRGKVAEERPAAAVNAGKSTRRR